MPTLVLSDNTGADYSGTDDVSLWAGIPTTNTNGFGALHTSKYGADPEHALLRFTALPTALAAIPAGNVITDAYIELYLIDAAGAGPHTITARRLLANWAQDQATYTERLTGTAWATPGATGAADRASVTSATGVIGATVNTYHQFTGAQLIQDLEALRDALTSNFGWHLERTDGAGDETYRTWENSEGTDGTRPRLVITHAAGSTGTQVLLPTAVVSAGTWQASAGSIPAAIDEATADASDYAYTSAASTLEVALAAGSTPGAGAHTVRYQIQGTVGVAMTVRLMQGAVEIAAWVHAPVPTVPTVFAQTLSAPQVSAITAYGSLRLRFEASI